MKIDMSVITAMVAFAVFVPSGSSEANVRLPVRCELPPSSALFSPSRDLTVLHEDLQFDCDSSGCRVSATYRIRSKQHAVLKMSFISPSSRVEAVAVNASDTKPGGVLVARFTDFSEPYAAARENVKRLANLINQADQKSAKSSATEKPDADANPEYVKLKKSYREAQIESERLYSMNKDNDHLVELFGKPAKLANTRPEECYALPDLSQPKGWEHYVACLSEGNSPALSEIMFGTKQQWELYQFDFDAAILPGENTVQVRYHQPYSFAEPYVAYFSSPSPMRYVSYELWPLKEWSLDPGFKIDITVRLHNPRHGFLNMKRDGLHVAAGRFKDTHHSGLLRNSPELSLDRLETPSDNQFVYRTSLQGNISDRLFIITGEEDTLNFVRKDFEQKLRFREKYDERYPLH